MTPALISALTTMLLTAPATAFFLVLFHDEVADLFAPVPQHEAGGRAPRLTIVRSEDIHPNAGRADKNGLGELMLEHAPPRGGRLADGLRRSHLDPQSIHFHPGRAQPNRGNRAAGVSTDAI